VKLLLVGLNHRTAPVAVRERYAVASPRLAGLLEKLVRLPSIAEAAIVSTCNRTEILAVAPDAEAAREALRRFLHGEIGDGGAAPDQTYELEEREVAQHLFRVAASLDSMVVGEVQILGQLKDAYRSALAARGLGPLLNRMFQHGFRAAKRVRSETGLGTSSVSVARIGVQLARRVFEDLSGKHVLLLGAGATAEAALQGLRDAGAREFSLVNRTLETARQLAERFGGHAHALDELGAELARADVVIASVQVDRPLLSRELLARANAHRHGTPVLVIDLGVPRNIEASANELPDVYVFDLDDIEAEAERGRAQRAGSMPAALAIVASEVEAYERWRAGLPLVPTIRRLRERVQAQVREELARGGASGPDAERLAEAIMGRILHEPLERLHREAEEGSGAYFAEAVQALFALEEEDV
jgi:glutamyl-tRNA reductase